MAVRRGSCHALPASLCRGGAPIPTPVERPSEAQVLTFPRGVPLHFHPLEGAEGGGEAGGWRGRLGVGTGGRGRGLEGPGVAVGWLFQTRRQGAGLAEGRVVHLAAEEKGAAAREDRGGRVVDVRPAVVGRPPERAREVVGGRRPQEAVVCTPCRGRCGARLVGTLQGAGREGGRGRGRRGRLRGRGWGQRRRARGGQGQAADEGAVAAAQGEGGLQGHGPGVGAAELGREAEHVAAAPAAATRHVLQVGAHGSGPRA